MSRKPNLEVKNAQEALKKSEIAMNTHVNCKMKIENVGPIVTVKMENVIGVAQKATVAELEPSGNIMDAMEKLEMNIFIHVLYLKVST